MDPMKKMRAGLFGGMKDYAKQSRLEKLKKRYQTGIPAVDKSMEEGDAAIEAAELPETPKKGAVVTISIDDMASDLDKWEAEGKKGLADATEANEEAEEEKKFFRGTGR